MAILKMKRTISTRGINTSKELFPTTPVVTLKAINPEASRRSGTLNFNGKALDLLGLDLTTKPVVTFTQSEDPEDETWYVAVVDSGDPELSRALTSKANYQNPTAHEDIMKTFELNGEKDSYFVLEMDEQSTKDMGVLVAKLVKMVEVSPVPEIEEELVDEVVEETNVTEEPVVEETTQVADEF